MKLRNSPKKHEPVIVQAPKKKTKNQLWRVFRYLTVICGLLIISILFYYNYYVKISGIIVVHTNKVTITSPGEAIVKDMKFLDEFDQVKEGEVIATLGVRHSDLLALKKDIHTYKTKLLEIDDSLKALESQTLEYELSFKEKTRGLMAEKKLLEEEIKLLKSSFSGMDKTIAMIKEEEANTEKLIELEVLDFSNLKSLKRDRLDVEKKISDISAKIDSKTNLITDLDTRLTKLNEDKNILLNELKSQSSTQLALKEHAGKKLKELEEINDGKNIDFTMYSPINGRVLQNHITSGDSLSKGDPIVTFYRPESMVIEAYLDERFMERISEGDKALVKIYKSKFESKVLRINKLISNSPKELRGRNLVREGTYYFSVILDSSNMPKGLFPGKTGTVIFTHDQ